MRHGLAPSLASILLAVLLSAPAAAAPTMAPSRAETTRAPAAARPRFLALGDSYTIGEGVPAAERWPVQLAALLRQAHTDIAEPVIVARTGFTTDELDQAIDAAAPVGPFALVTLLIGVNDQYRGLPKEDFRERYRALLGRAIGFAGSEPSHVVALSFPDYGETPFAASRGLERARVAGEVARFNGIIREETERAGVPYVHVAGLEDRDPEAFLAADGLHPSGRLYALWARTALPEAQKALRDVPDRHATKAK